MTIAHPLTTEQLACAKAIHSRLDEWRRADEALQALGKKFPHFTESSTLLKVVAINSLYGTRLFAVLPMAKHIQRINEEIHIQSADLSLVDRIAALPSKGKNQSIRHHAVFASKFAHFFINDKKYPILDSYAERMLKKHLGKCYPPQRESSRYLAFAEGAARLRYLSGVTCSFRELDHYLWIAGNYIAWRKNHAVQMNSELRNFFNDAPPGGAKELEQLLPFSMTRA